MEKRKEGFWGKTGEEGKEGVWDEMGGKGEERVCKYIFDICSPIFPTRVVPSNAVYVTGSFWLNAGSEGNEDGKRHCTWSPTYLPISTSLRKIKHSTSWYGQVYGLPIFSNLIPSASMVPKYPQLISRATHRIQTPRPQMPGQDVDVAA